MKVLRTVIFSWNIQLLCNCAVVKKSVFCLGPRCNMITNLLCHCRMTHLVHKKGVYWRHSYSLFPLARRKEAVWFRFSHIIAYCVWCIIYHERSVALWHFLFWVFSFIYLKIYHFIILKYLYVVIIVNL